MLTQERATLLINTLRAGTPLKTAAAYAGVTDEAVRKWRRRGEKALEIPAGRRSPTERRFADFVGQLDQALAEASVQAQATVRQLMTVPRDADAARSRVALEAAKFHLTARDPENYNTRTRTELTGANGAPLSLEVNGDAAVDLLAPLLAQRGIIVEDDDDE